MNDFDAGQEVLVNSEGYWSHRQKLTDQKVNVVQLASIALNPVLVIENLYFDLGSHKIRPDAALILDELSSTLKSNPSVNIFLSAHTDSRGSAQSNADLSKRRANSSRDYLIKSGIDPERIKADGFGESKLVNKCKDGVRCSEKEHQKNRRVEVEVIRE